MANVLVFAETRGTALRKVALEAVTAARAFADASGGGEVHAYMLEKRLADQVILYIAPKVIGGPAKTWVGGKGLASLAAAYKLEYEGDPVFAGPDLRLTLVRAPDPPPRDDGDLFDDD